MSRSSFARGILIGVIGFVFWGLLPLYWKLLAPVDILHVLSFRIVLSLLVIGTILTIQKNSAWITVFKDRRKGGFQILAALFLCFNWGVYVWAVNSGHALEGSLGYYINPLVSIVLGLLFFREKLSFLQWAAFVIAAAGVAILTLLSGRLPWVSLSLAVSFGFYGLLKKKLNLSAMESLGAETLAAFPLGLFLLFSHSASGLAPRLQNISYLAALGSHTLIPLALIGAISLFPLYCFANAAKLLPLSTLGFLQFISPTMQFFLAVFIFDEYFPVYHLAAFSFIWLAVILYIISLRSLKKKPKGA